MTDSLSNASTRRLTTAGAVALLLALACAGLWLAPANRASAATTTPRTGAATAPAPGAADALYKADAGPWAVKVTDEDWRDEARKRTLPVRIYLPQRGASDKAGAATQPSKFPVVLFSHGWGASRFSYGYFCQHQASHGYLVVVPNHPGSDMASIPLWGGAAGAGKQENLIESIADPENLRNRPHDISFLIDELGRRPSMKDVADLDRIGVAGHSFGAYTAMAIGGMLVDLPEGKARSFRDPRVKAVLPMSPEGHGMMGIAPGAWDKFGAPVLFLTGTKDYGSGQRPAAWRREGFDGLHGADAYLVVINDATHFTFAFPGGFGGVLLQNRSRAPATDSAHDARLIQALGTAFFDSTLCAQPRAAAWFSAYFAAKHPDATAEFKPAHAGH